ncbi:MAG: HEAT repeat domain-containing protein [Planctomycetota bacterium]
MKSEALDKAFEALKTYNWGAERKLVDPINDAVVSSYGNADARAALESRLAAVLKTDISRDAKDVVCRHLRTIGTAKCVPTLASLLGDKDLSHMARYALERIQDDAAGTALREALGKVSGALKAGVAGSLGARADQQSASALAGLLEDKDASIVAAAATALGNIAAPHTAGPLAMAAKKAPTAAKRAVIDGALRAAEALSAAGKATEANVINKALSGDDMPKHVRQAATRA